MKEDFEKLGQDIEELFKNVGKETGKLAKNLKEEADRYFSCEGKEVKERFEVISERMKVQAQELGASIKKMANDEQKKKAFKEGAEKFSESIKAFGAEVLFWPDDHYRDLMLQLILKHAPVGDEKLIICKRDEKRINEEFIAKANAELIKAGKKGELTLSSERADISGGFILRGKEGIETNCSLDSMFAQMGKNIEDEIKKAFS